MIPNRVFVAAFGAALVALAIYHAVTAAGVASVILPAIGGLFLVNLSLRRRRGGFGHWACAHQPMSDKPGAPVA